MAYTYFLAFRLGLILTWCSWQCILSFGDLVTSMYSFKRVCSATLRLKSVIPRLKNQICNLGCNRTKYIYNNNKKRKQKRMFVNVKTSLQMWKAFSPSMYLKSLCGDSKGKRTGSNTSTTYFFLFATSWRTQSMAAVNTWYSSSILNSSLLRSFTIWSFERPLNSSPMQT